MVSKSTFQHLQFSQLLFVIAFNLMPLMGVILLGWSALDLVYLYAAENIFILVFSCLKFRLSSFEYLFAYFYATFCAVQMFVLLTLLGEIGMIVGYDKNLSLLDLNLLVIDQEDLYVGLVIMLISYAIDFIRSTLWFKNKKFNSQKNVNPSQAILNNRPAEDSIFLIDNISLFHRLALMQITLIVGGILVLVFKTALFALVVLLLLKLVFEIAMRVRASAQQSLRDVAA